MLTATPETPKKQRLRLPFLDGVRGLASLYVVIYHICQHCELVQRLPGFLGIFKFGHLAVTVFIVLSGFSLMLPVVTSGEDRIVNFGDYVKRRASRILPPYYAALLLFTGLTVFVPLFNEIDSQSQIYNTLPANIWPSLISHVLLLHNLDSQWIYRFDGPMWSVATEWDIYFLFPLLLLPIRKRFGTMAAVVIGFAVGLISFKISLAPACFWYAGSFAIGMLGAELVFGKHPSQLRPVHWLTCSVLCLAGAWAVSRNWVGHLFIDTGFKFVGDALASVSAVSLLIALGLQSKTENPGSLSKLFTWRPIEQLGIMSYSLYLIHHPLVIAIGNLLAKHQITGHTMLLIYFCCLPVILLVTYLFHLVFEKPFMRFPKPA